jgi:hypothetical protein
MEARLDLLPESVRLGLTWMASIASCRRACSCGENCCKEAYIIFATSLAAFFCSASFRLVGTQLSSHAWPVSCQETK